MWSGTVLSSTESLRLPTEIVSTTLMVMYKRTNRDRPIAQSKLAERKEITKGNIEEKILLVPTHYGNSLGARSDQSMPL